MANQDEILVADLIVEYYNWLTDNGGTSSDELLSRTLTPPQRRMLLERMEDVNVVVSATSPMHRAAGNRHSRLRG
jgi:hypothetical protein